MTLMTRLIKLCKADAHGLLDLFEDPEATLRQAIRDMQAEIDSGEQVLSGLVRKAERLQGLRAALEAQLREHERQIDLCFAEGADDLARTCIRQRLEAQKRLRAVSQMVDDTAARQAAQRRTLQEHHDQLRSVIEKLHVFVDPPPSMGMPDPVSPEASWVSAVSDDDVEIAFLDERRKRSRGKTDSTAAAEGDMQA